MTHQQRQARKAKIMTAPKSATYNRRIQSARTAHQSRINHIPPQPIPAPRPAAAPRQPSKIEKWWAKGHRVTLGGKAKWLILLIMVGVFLGGMAMGEKRAQQSPDFHKPSATTLGVLDYAKQSGGTNCKIVWNVEHQLNTVVCDHPVQLINQDADHDPQK